MKTAGGILAAFLVGAVASAADPPPSSKSHAHSLSGTVAAIDGPGRTLTVRDAKGKETKVQTTDATRVSGGKLEPGAKVTVRWMLRDHKSIATAVRVHAPEPERTASATVPSPPAPTPKSP